MICSISSRNCSRFDFRPYFSNPVYAARICCRTRVFPPTYTLPAQPVDRRVFQRFPRRRFSYPPSRPVSACVTALHIRCIIGPSDTRSGAFLGGHTVRILLWGFRTVAFGLISKPLYVENRAVLTEVRRLYGAIHPPVSSRIEAVAQGVICHHSKKAQPRQCAATP